LSPDRDSFVIGTEWCASISARKASCSTRICSRTPDARSTGGETWGNPDSLCASLGLSHVARLGSSDGSLQLGYKRELKNAQKTGPKEPAFYRTATLELQGGRRLESSGRHGVLTA
jgi:hypothetical protein